MALIDPKDAENIYNESGWAARRKEAREWRDAFTAREILEAVDELPEYIVLLWAGYMPSTASATAASRSPDRIRSANASISGAVARSCAR